MPKFKVVNPDAPEEIDFYQDIPLVDPETGMDQLDSDGNILVKRYVNHTVSIKGITEVKNALPAIKTNTQNLEELYQYSHAQNEAQQVAIINNASAIVDLQTSTSEMALDLETLTNKINGIQGIDIDDLKDYVYTQVPLIKNSYLPLVGGTITGNLTIEEGTITGSLTGVASKATADVNNKKLTSYVADIMGANAQLSIIKGDGTTSVLSINNVLSATKATNADNATNLGGYPATDYIRSVNGINADNAGNVNVTLSGYELVYWETDYFDIAVNGLYSFDLSNTAFANISKDAIDIQMVAKVKTAQNGFKVGDYVYSHFANYIGNAGGVEEGSTPYISGNVLSIRFGNDPSFVHLGSNGSATAIGKTNVKVKLILTTWIKEV